MDESMTMCNTNTNSAGAKCRRKPKRLATRRNAIVTTKAARIISEIGAT
jgi:hypothetical protein